MTVLKTLLTSSALVLAAGAAAAAPAVGLVGDRTLVVFDTETLAVSETMDVGGVDRLLGIDLRPGNATLVGVTDAQAIVTIDLDTGVATEIATMATPLALGDAPVVVDFNPSADRLRYMTGTTNHRVNVDTGETIVDGTLAFTATDAHAGETPAIVAAAYINSRGKPEATAMYDIDATSVALIRQVSPNEGTLAMVGELGISAADTYAFDVHTAADGTNTAFLAADNTIYTVNLETGAATAVGALDGVSGMIRDMTVLAQ